MGKPQMMVRRRGLVGSLLLVLGGCGFRSVYGPSGGSAGAEDELSAISVGLIPNRVGQLLRLALQDKLERGGAGVAQRYDLSVSFNLSSEALSIQTGNTSSRVRLVGNAAWVLTAQDVDRRTLKSGSAREVDGYNIFNNQYFASDQENDAVQRRMVEALSEQIALQLAIYFNQRTAKG
jgi:LPS-assembly lipoprotein